MLEENFIEKLNKLFSEFELKDYISGIIFKPTGNICKRHIFAFNLKDERENHKFFFIPFVHEKDVFLVCNLRYEYIIKLYKMYLQNIC